MYNFISTFDELNKLYEEADVKKAQQDEKIEEACKEELTEAAEEEEIEIVDDETSVEEMPIEEPVVDGEEPKQTIIECSKCGVLVIVDEVIVDEESDLVNVEDECKFCEEKEGYKIVGSVIPYEATEASDEAIEADEQIDEAFEIFKGPVKWSKLKKNHTLEVVDGTEFKKGDLFVEIKPENINKIADDDVANYVAKVSPAGRGVELHLGGSQGTVICYPDKKYVKAVKGNGTQVEEDLADIARKVFDRPASVATQQRWEDELNDDSISDKRRKHLEKKFLQQRDWEERHPDKEVK